MTEILRYKTIEMEVDTFGGFVNWVNDNGENIIYPKQEVITYNDEIKNRGGIFSCFPNFGIDEVNGQKQHGYARESEWRIFEKKDSSIVLYLKGIGQYENLETYLKYELNKKGLEVILDFENFGEKNLLIAPGLHPYFYSEKSYVRFKNKEYSKNELENSVFIKDKNIEFETKDYRFKYRSNDFETYVFWTDFNGDYICVEPTLNGTSFRKEYESYPYGLKSREKRKLKIQLSWVNK